MDRAQIDEVRQFNRTVTERVGILQAHHLGRDRTVGEARPLWEIGNGQGWDVRRLRDRLGLDSDSGYTSRLLRSLADAGLVSVQPNPRDRRVRMVERTETGCAERATLDLLSDELAASLLAPLNDQQRAALTAAMSDVTRLLSAAAVTLYELDPDHHDAQYCLRSYYAEMNERLEVGLAPLLSALP